MDSRWVLRSSSGRRASCHLPARATRVLGASVRGTPRALVVISLPPVANASRGPGPFRLGPGPRTGAVLVLRLLAGLVRDRHLEQGGTAYLAPLSPGGQAEQGVGAGIEDEQGLAALERPADADPR